MPKRLLSVVCLAVVGCSAPGPESRTDTAALHAYRIAAGTPDEILVREIERGPNTSVVEVFVHKFGGALGGSMFQMACFADMAKSRGNSHYVTLAEEMIRKGSTADPGNDMRVTIGFCNGSTAAELQQFGAAAAKLEPRDVQHVDDGKELMPPIEQYRVPAASQPR